MDYYKNLYLSSKSKYSFLQNAMNLSQDTKLAFIFAHLGGDNTNKNLNIPEDNLSLADVLIHGRIQHCYENKDYNNTSKDVHRTYGVRLCAMGISQTASDMMTNLKKQITDNKEPSTLEKELNKIITDSINIIKKDPKLKDEKDTESEITMNISITLDKLKTMSGELKELQKKHENNNNQENKNKKIKNYTEMIKILKEGKNDTNMEQKINKELNNPMLIDNDQKIKKLEEKIIRLQEVDSKKLTMEITEDEIETELKNLKNKVNALILELKKVPEKLKDLFQTKKILNKINNCKNSKNDVARNNCFHEILTFFPVLEKLALDINDLTDKLYGKLALDIYSEYYNEIKK